MWFVSKITPVFYYVAIVTEGKELKTGKIMVKIQSIQVRKLNPTSKISGKKFSYGKLKVLSTLESLISRPKYLIILSIFTGQYLSTNVTCLMTLLAYVPALIWEVRTCLQLQLQTGGWVFQQLYFLCVQPEPICIS